MGSVELQNVIASPGAGSEAFALQALHSAVDAAKQENIELPPGLIKAAQSLHSLTAFDGRALIPVLSAMTADDALGSLSKLVMLDSVHWKSALSKLLIIISPEN